MSLPLPTLRTIYTQDNLALLVRDFISEESISANRLPLVALPGITRNGKDFDDFAAKLDPSERLITIDFRGRGGSDYDPNYRNYHPTTYVQDVGQVLTALNLHRVILVGTSLGGLVSIGLAIARPTSIAGIVLNDIGPVINPGGLGKLKTIFGNKPVFDSFEHAANHFKTSWSHAFPDVADDFWIKFAYKLCVQTSDTTVEAAYDPGIGRAVLEGIGRTETDPWAFWQALQNIPTLLVHGALSEFMTAEIAAEMTQRKPDLITCTLDNRGHTPILDEPKAVEALTSFFDKVNELSV